MFRHVPVLTKAARAYNNVSHTLRIYKIEIVVSGFCLIRWKSFENGFCLDISESFAIVFVRPYQNRLIFCLTNIEIV